MYEELINLLVIKCSDNLDRLVANANEEYATNLNFTSGQAFLCEFAYRYVIYNEICDVLVNMDLSCNEIEALLNLDNPLEEIYGEWIAGDNDFAHSLAESVRQKIIEEFRIHPYIGCEEELEIKPVVSDAERKLAFTGERTFSARTGCIGHLTIDISDSSSGGLYTQWTNHCSELNTPEFKNEFDELMDKLQEKAFKLNVEGAVPYASVLKNFNTMKAWCACFPEAALQDRDMNYIFRIDTEKYTYILRFGTKHHFYSYIYAYDKQTVERYFEYEKTVEKIRILVVAVDCNPSEVVVRKELETYQNIVDGHIECVYPFDDNVCIVCNEEGKTRGLDINRPLRDRDGKICDYICGDMFIVGLNDDAGIIDFQSLTDEQIEKYTKMFHIRGTAN